jgi:hypothetical protein
METAIKVCASSLKSEDLAKQLFKYYIFCCWWVQRSSSWSQKSTIGHGLNKANLINVFEPNLSNTKFCLCLDFQSGICTLRYATKNFVSINSLNRAWLTSYLSYPPRRKYGSSVRRWMQIWDYLIPYLTTIQIHLYKSLHVNELSCLYCEQNTRDDCISAVFELSPYRNYVQTISQ